MASNTLGFAIIIIVILIAAVPLVQSIGLSIDAITTSQGEQLEKQTQLMNQDISVDAVITNGETEVVITNTGNENINAQKLTVLFDNVFLEIEDGVEPTIAGDTYPNERTIIPTGESLEVQFNQQPDDRVRVINSIGIRAEASDFNE